MTVGATAALNNCMLVHSLLQKAAYSTVQLHFTCTSKHKVSLCIPVDNNSSFGRLGPDKCLVLQQMQSGEAQAQRVGIIGTIKLAERLATPSPHGTLPAIRVYAVPCFLLPACFACIHHEGELIRAMTDETGGVSDLCCCWRHLLAYASASHEGFSPLHLGQPLSPVTPSQQAPQ